MAILAIDNTTIENNTIHVTALVEDMCLIRKATYYDPDEWAPALCSASFELADDESIPLDENGFCLFLDHLQLQWELIDTSDYYAQDLS